MEGNCQKLNDSENRQETKDKITSELRILFHKQKNNIHHLHSILRCVLHPIKYQRFCVRGHQLYFLL